MKKCLIVMLALVLALTACLPTLAFAESETTEEEAPNYSVNEGLDDAWWNILLMGCDSYTVKSYSRSDSMVIMSVNMETKEVKLTSLMRDTWLKASGRSSSMKLTEACVYGGPAMTLRAINENFGMNISDYVLVSMEGMAEIIDIVGGLDIEITESERKAINGSCGTRLSQLSEFTTVSQSGMVHLNGNQATAFARIRKIDSDYVRTERQRTVLVALANKIKENNDAVTLLALIGKLMSYVETTLTLPELISLGTLGLGLDIDSIQQTRIPADGTFDSGMYGNTWCIKPNFEKNAGILHEFIYGQAE